MESVRAALGVLGRSYSRFNSFIHPPHEDWRLDVVEFEMCRWNGTNWEYRPVTHDEWLDYHNEILDISYSKKPPRRPVERDRVISRSR